MDDNSDGVIERPKACNAGRAAIERLASDFAEAVKLEPGDQLDSLVKSLGGEIVYLGYDDASKHDKESIKIEADGSFVIYLPPYTNEERDRFTIAHELGHLFLHFPIRNDTALSMAANRLGSTIEEWEANWFAAELLMPEKDFRSIFDAHSGCITNIAEYFRVSAKAAEIRAENLGLNNIVAT
jgi:Zn-dependent peptidase ImmA (M78 family)